MQYESKPVWQMDEGERGAEQMRRLKFMAADFAARGGTVHITEETLHLTTPANHYFVDVAVYDPRIIKLSVVYEVVPGDLDRASWAAYNAQASTHAAKAKAIPHGSGYRLHFTAEVFAIEVTDFSAAIAIYQAAIEDCRERFLDFMHQSIDMEAISWSLQPQPRQT